MKRIRVLNTAVLRRGTTLKYTAISKVALRKICLYQYSTPTAMETIHVFYEYTYCTPSMKKYICICI
jgi:hypothetical protein